MRFPPAAPACCATELLREEGRPGWTACPHGVRLAAHAHHRRTAIIGAGNIAGAHAKAYRSAGDRVELVAAVDVDPERLDAFCDEHGIDGRHTDLAAMLADAEPDLVSVCTPPGLHAGLSIQAMRAGAWVWCEKPLCASLAELDKVQSVERETRGCRCCSVA